MGLKSNKTTLFWLFTVLCFIFVFAILMLVPEIDLVFFLVLFPAVILPAGIVIFQAINGNFFTILTFYSMIFFLECFGGAMVVSLSNPLGRKESLGPELTNKTVGVLFFGYILFLAGYYIVYRRLMKRWIVTHSHTSSMAYNSKYILSKRGWITLFVILLVFTGLNFVQPIQRIQAAGGIDAYFEFMYLYRFGIFSKDAVESAGVSLANMVGGLSLSVASIGLISFLKNRINKLKLFFLLSFLGVIILQALMSTFRSTAFFTVLALVAVYDSVRPLGYSKLIKLGASCLGLLILFNYIHQYLFAVTAGWDYQTLTESLGWLIAPHGHVITLSLILSTAEHSSFLHGETFLESLFFFIPRFVWEGKAEQYGTKIVQIWAGLPGWYQMAPTNVGELIAHFGYVGIFGMLLYGLAHGYLETFRYRSPSLRGAYYCLILPRLLVHLGMGISAVSVTIFQLGLLFIVAKTLQYRSIGAPRDYRMANRETLP
jgi:hypothetical protein